MNRLLLVEDNMGDILIFNEYLKEHGDQYEIHTALSLKSALEKLENNTYDIILLDLNLPDSIGVNTLKQIVGLKKGIPIIVFTFLDDEFYWQEIARNGADDYLVKGQYDAELLHKRITFALNKIKPDLFSLSSAH